MIIAVGFKVDNENAVQFRKWANAVVKDFTIQGWVMDDERLKLVIYLAGFSLPKNELKYVFPYSLKTDWTKFKDCAFKQKRGLKN